MTEYDYVIRDDNFAESFTLEENEIVNLHIFLEEQYPYILEEMKKEEYIIEYDYFEDFNELTYENKVIGFFTTSNAFIDDIAIIILEEIYVMPEFRGNYLLYKVILSLFTSLNMHFTIRNPTRMFMEKLIKANLAAELEDNIVYTRFDLFDEYYNVYTDSKIAREYDFNELEYDSYATNYYDLNRSTMISIEDPNITHDKKDVPVISTPRKNDINKYHITDKLLNIDRKYSRKVRKIIHRHKEDIRKIDKYTAYTFFKNLKVDNILGTEDKMSTFFKSKLKKHDLSEEDGLSIRKKIVEALESDQIDEISLPYRLGYLLENPDSDAVVDKKKNVEGKCPYCNADIEESFEYCEICGLCMNEDYSSDDNQDNPIIEIDENTGLEVEFLNKISQKGYDSKEIYNLQLDVASYQFLELIDNNPSYPGLPYYTEKLHIRDGDVEEFLEKEGYVKKIINNNYNPDYLLESGFDNYNLPRINFMDEYIYKITKKGRRFYKKNKIADAFDSQISKLEYYEFYYYCQDNPDLKASDNADNFFKLKMDEAIACDDEKLYLRLLECRFSKSLSAHEEVDVVCFNLLQTMIASVNSYKLSHPDDDKYPIEDNLIMSYSLFKSLIYQDEIDIIYDDAFDKIELDKLRINKEDIREVIEDMDKKINEDNKQENDYHMEVLNR